MADKILLDVNVCLDVLLKRLPHMDSAARIFQAIEDDRIEAMISAISFDTLFYVLRPALGSSGAQQELLRLREQIEVAAVGAEAVDRALNAGWKDFEDALQYFSAQSNGCEAIITRNKKDFPDDSSTPVYTATEYLEVCRR